MNRLVASTMLENYKVKVTEACNGLEAIEKIKENSFDVVLMDVQMPIMDGIEATRIIKETISKELPIIALTAFAVKGDKEKIMQNGMDDYISKPFEENDFLSKIIAQFSGAKIESKPTTKKIIEVKKTTEEKLLYNLSKLEDIAKGNEAFIQKMIKLFIDQTPISIAEIKEAFTNDDTIKVGKIAHRIKPSIDNLGIEILHQVIRDIEKNATTYSKETLQDSINFVEMTIAELIIQLKKIQTL
jgi:CheY-like chemotaxis protein